MGVKKVRNSNYRAEKREYNQWKSEERKMNKTLAEVWQKVDERIDRLQRTHPWYFCVYKNKPAYPHLYDVRNQSGELYEWLNTCIAGEWDLFQQWVGFKNPDDAFAFKLRWM